MLCANARGCSVVRSRKRLQQPLTIPRDQDNVILSVDRKDVRLTNLRKIFWQELGLTKGDLLQYYADVAAVLLPHLADRAMVMKRYPHGASGEFFFMKRAPSPRPDWIQICTIITGRATSSISRWFRTARPCCGSSISAVSI